MNKIVTTTALGIALALSGCAAGGAAAGPPTLTKSTSSTTASPSYAPPQNATVEPQTATPTALSRAETVLRLGNIFQSGHNPGPELTAMSDSLGKSDLAGAAQHMQTASGYAGDFAEAVEADPDLMATSLGSDSAAVWHRCETAYSDVADAILNLDSDPSIKEEFSNCTADINGLTKRIRTGS